MVILTKLNKKDFKNILDNYGIGNYKSHKNIPACANTVYIVNTTKGKFIIKIYEGAKLNYVKDQITLMEFLKKTKVSTPKIIDTKKKQGLFIYKEKRLAIQEFVKGKETEKVGETLAKDLGKKFGMLTKTLRNFKGKDADNWKKNHEFKKLICKNKIEYEEIKEESSKVSKKMKFINKSKLRKSIVHGDLSEANFLVSKNKLTAIIDWDDFHEDYTLYEIAVTISHVFVTEKIVKTKLIKLFLKEYERYFKLNSEEQKSLYYFIKMRMLDASKWCIDMSKIHKNRKKELMLWARIIMNKYKSFSKLSLEEFLRLLK